MDPPEIDDGRPPTIKDIARCSDMNRSTANRDLGEVVDRSHRVSVAEAAAGHKNGHQPSTSTLKPP